MMYRVNYGNGRVSATFGSLRAAVAVLVSDPDEPRAFVQSLEETTEIGRAWCRLPNELLSRALTDHTRSVL